MITALSLGSALDLHPKVSIRLDSCGALLYDFGTRRLVFVKEPNFAELLHELPRHSSIGSTLHSLTLESSRTDAYLRALEDLRDREMLIVRDASSAVDGALPRRVAHETSSPRSTRSLTQRLKGGLAAPICITWELTYACNLSCSHCLSSSGKRDPDELTTEEAKGVIDELEAMGVFYVNIGGGEPTIRSDFWDLIAYATSHHVGVKFSSNGSRITPEAAATIAKSDYVDVQISLDGATVEVNDGVRGEGSYATAMRAMDNLAEAGARGFKISVVVTRHNVSQLDEFKAIADSYGAQLRITRLRPSGRGADVWHELHPTAEQQLDLYSWLRSKGEQVLTGDSFFHLSALGESLPGLNMCGAGRIVCLVDPVGDVYACPFVIHEAFRAGNVRGAGGFEAVWTRSPAFQALREPGDGGTCSSCSAFDSCGSGCMAAKFFTGLPLEGPDPECVMGHGAEALRSVDRSNVPMSTSDHSARRPRLQQVNLRARVRSHPLPERACDESPLAGFDFAAADVAR